jgi:hypothetical protein
LVGPNEGNLRSCELPLLHEALLMQPTLFDAFAPMRRISIDPFAEEIRESFVPCWQSYMVISEYMKFVAQINGVDALYVHKRGSRPERFSIGDAVFSGAALIVGHNFAGPFPLQSASIPVVDLRKIVKFFLVPSKSRRRAYQ